MEVAYNNNKLVLVLIVFSFGAIINIQSLKADLAVYDAVWQERAEEAKKNMMDAYVPNPLAVTEEVNTQVNENNGNETMDPSIGEQTNNSIAWPPEAAAAAPTANAPTNSEMGANVNGTRRNLRQGKTRYRGPCHTTNPIDRCWRCRKNWALNRKRLASCALGFGRRTIGGKAGRFYTVTDNTDDNALEPKPGTLRHAVIQKEPLWIIFSKDMNIKLNHELLVSSNKTIDGRGANIHIAFGAGITIQFATNVIIHGLHIHHISSAGGGMIRDSVDHYGIRTVSDGDGISIFGSTNIWIDHVSMSRCQDGLIDAIQGSTGITISNSHFTHHNDAILLGASDSFSGDQFMQVTVAFNHFGQGLVQRMPRCRWGFFHVVNNDYTHWLLYAIGGSMHPTIISQGNRFIAPDDQYIKEITKRDYAPETEWRKWTWRSEGDLMMNGAFFVESGEPGLHMRPSKKYMITPKPGHLATRMTRFAGALNCKPGRKC